MQLLWSLFTIAVPSLISVAASAQEVPCTRPAAGSMVIQPKELRSQNRVLTVDLTYRNFKAADGVKNIATNRAMAARLLRCVFNRVIC
jgi:hypothetical protein